MYRSLGLEPLLCRILCRRLRKLGLRRPIALPLLRTRRRVVLLPAVLLVCSCCGIPAFMGTSS